MSKKILVIGAGLGGLTAALALRKAGFSVEVHEAAPALGEVGAGLTLSRGAQSVFRHLGIQDRVAAISTPAAQFPFVHYRSGELLAGEIIPSQGLPDDGVADIARQCHRADLHAILVAALDVSIRLDHRLVAIDQSGTGVRVSFASGATVEGDMLVAADGVRSAARPLLWNDAPPRYTGQVAYRFLVGRTEAAAFLDHGRGAVFIGPGATFNRYTLRGGELVNCVGIVASDAWVDEGWQTAATREEIAAHFANWHPQVTGLIAYAERPVKWGIFDRAPLPQWTQSRVTLLGDAAHAMLPFLGMGAAMAIEDGMVLARALSVEPDLRDGLTRYESARRERTALVHGKSVEQGLLTQARDPDKYRHAGSPAADPTILGYDPVTAVI